MSDLPKSDTLCERCSLLSFDDAAIGGVEVTDEDGIARVSFPESQIEFRPSDWLERQELYNFPPDYRLVRLGWELDDILPDMPRLSRSSELGCGFCRALRTSLEETFAREAKSNFTNAGAANLVAYLSLVDRDVEGLVVEAICNPTGLDGSNSAIQTIFPIEGDFNFVRWLGSQPARDASYLDPENIRQMRQLLDDCASKCHPETTSSFMPTRLIDVGHDASAIARLVLSSDISKTKQTKYAALSYCWGSEKDAESQFKTEKASLEHRCIALPSEVMTPTTNDAIALAKAIGLRYLWIDALCIVQDDEDDWSHESSQMNLVYRHAFVTFCSLNSDSCHERFLYRAPAVEIPFQSTIRRAIKGSYFIRLRSIPDLHMDRTKLTWDYALSKWNARCWTFQEKEMSTRRLDFGSLRMHFACAKYRWSEGDDAPLDRYTLGVMEQMTLFKDNLISSKDLYDFWGSLLQGYGHRSVTFDKDRLPAIAGLARMMGEALQDQYLAGLWKGDLQSGLVWFSGGTHDKLSRSLETHLRNIRQRNYVAPSWSWAACPSVVTRRNRSTLVEESTIMDVNTDKISEDPYGQVSGGFLRISGKLAPLPKSFPNDMRDVWSNHWGRFMNEDFNHVDIYTDWLHKDKEAGLEALVVMLLHNTEREDGGEVLRGLLLHPANELGHYYRVGVLDSGGNNACRQIRGWFEDSQEETICII